MIKSDNQNPLVFVFYFDKIYMFVSYCQKNLEIILFPSSIKLISVLWSILRLQHKIQDLGKFVWFCFHLFLMWEFMNYDIFILHFIDYLLGKGRTINTVTV